MKRIMQYMKEHTWCYVAAVSAMVLAIILDMYNPYLIKRIIDDVIIGNNASIFMGALAGLLLITFGRAVLGYTKEYMFDYSSSKIVMDLRNDLFNHIQKLSFSFFDKNNTGELMSRIKEDTENVLHALAFGIMLFLEQSMYFIIATVILFYLNWKLALVSIATMPFIAWLAVKLEKEIGATFEEISDQRALLNTTAQENIAGVRLVKAFGREKYEIEKFLEQNKKNYELNVKQAHVWSKFHPKIELLSNLAIVLVTTAGGYMVIGEKISMGTLVAFSNYIYMLVWPMRMIGWLTNILAQCMASLHKIEKIFEEQPEIKNSANPAVLKEAKGHVKFENVNFEYNGTQVLKNINIDAKPGSTIAIMGMTGAGKSSITNLISRFYDCSSGRVLVDGNDVKDLDLNSLRRHISVVMQDTFLFSDTIQENISFGSEHISSEDLIQAAKDAQANDFILRLSHGYETVIGERGVGLSGGQKQRVSIARALARENSILILDDATSALDMETEYHIQKALEKRKGMTKFIIAHRVSAVMHADEILIVENGEIVERGTHKALMKLKGRYYDIYNEQFKGIQDIEEQEVV